MVLSAPVNSISQGLMFLVRADNFHGVSCANMAVDNVESIVHAGSGYVAVPPFYPPDTSTQSKFFERLSHVARIPKKNSFIIARKKCNQTIIATETQRESLVRPKRVTSGTAFSLVLVT